MIVPLIPGQFCSSRVGLVEGDVVVEETLAMVVLDMVVVDPLEEYVLLFRRDDVVVFKLIVGRALADVLKFEYDDTDPEIKEVMFEDVVTVEKPVLATTDRVLLKDEGSVPVLPGNEELEFSDIVGNPDVGRVVKLEFSEIVGNPDVGRGDELELSEIEGIPELMGLKEVILASEGGKLAKDELATVLESEMKEEELVTIREDDAL
ncbi:MAG: hypothetical protein LQ351_005986 [Letrouitia transgressa]|nr:MAG: hypothetical protein LQ351_005986 [Letrouitia transgressa]